MHFAGDSTPTVRKVSAYVAGDGSGLAQKEKVTPSGRQRSGTSARALSEDFLPGIEGEQRTCCLYECMIYFYINPLAFWIHTEGSSSSRRPGPQLQHLLLQGALQVQPPNHVDVADTDDAQIQESSSAPSSDISATYCALAQSLEHLGEKVHHCPPSPILRVFFFFFLMQLEYFSTGWISKRLAWKTCPRPQRPYPGGEDAQLCPL